MRKYLFFSFIFLTLSLFSEEIPLDAKIFVAGHTGLVGKALMRKLASEGYNNIITKDYKELDLRSQEEVRQFFEKEKPEYVFLAAAKVGGIKANSDFPAEFLYDNLAIQMNIIHQSYLSKVKKLLCLGSTCIYPRDCPQPIKEEYLLSGPLEKTNEPYAIAKITGLKLCETYNKQYGCHFISCMPTNLYGPEDHFDLNNSHVIPALISKIMTAKEKNLDKVEIWGTGTPTREFLYVDDLADALLFLMRNYEDSQPINVGFGKDISIKDLAYLIQEIVGYTGEIYFNPEKPDGTPKKCSDTTKITHLGWKPTVSLREGLQKTIQWYEELVEK